METINRLKGLYPDPEKFFDEQGPAQLVVNYDDVAKISDVFTKTQITLQMIDECYSDKKQNAGVEYVTHWFLMVNDFLNITRTIPKNTIKQLSYMVYKRHSHFTLADMKLLFEYILESRYGTFYGSIDTQTILTSFLQYSRERNEALTKIKEQELKELKEKQRNEKEGVPVDLSKYKNIARFLNQSTT